MNENKIFCTMCNQVKPITAMRYVRVFSDPICIDCVNEQKMDMRQGLILGEFPLIAWAVLMVEQDKRKESLAKRKFM